jgi:hypothetical protein
MQRNPYASLTPLFQLSAKSDSYSRTLRQIEERRCGGRT